MQEFRDLLVWQKAHALTLGAYKATSAYPSSELYGLTSQTRRASASIAANIAEGCGRGSDADFARFLQIAMGSASEVEYFVLLARDLGFLPQEPFTKLTDDVTEVKRTLTGLMGRIRRKN